MINKTKRTALPALLCAASLITFLCLPSFLYSAQPTFRTDDGNQKLPWFQLSPGEFPPEGSAHHIGGELISMDHINRTGAIRIDRTDSIRRSEWDHPLPFTMLSYGSFRYHGAPAELRDIPIGTHLHGFFYIDEKHAKDGNGPFSRAILMEDDFSFCADHHRAWRIDSVDLEKGTLIATGVGLSANQTDPKETLFVINSATRVWKDRTIGTLKDLAPGQSVILNLTLCTLKGPGRCTDVWIDAHSREVASALQMEVHHQFIYDHGIAGRVDEVDNQQGFVTVTLFEGFDPKLKEEYKAGAAMIAAVAEESLRTYDQSSDRMRGEVIEVQNVAAGPGNSGFRVKFKPVTLLEGFRPKRIVRLFSGTRKLDDIPREERLYQ